MGRWLLEIDHGRDVARWADPGPTTAAIGLGAQSGTLTTFFAGLDLGELELPDGADVEIAIELERAEPLLTFDDLDRLEGAPALLRRQLDDGTTIPILRGVVTDVERGALAEPVKLSIVSPPFRASALIPSPTSAVSEETWPITGGFVGHAADLGRICPRIIGAPGNVPGGTALEGSPAILAELDPGVSGTLVVSDGRVGASIVRVYCPQSRDDPAFATYSDTAPIVYQNDLTGRSRGTVDVPGSMLPAAEGQTYYIGWGASGGMLSPRTGEGIRGWAEVVEAVLTEGGYPVDVSKLRGEAHFLDRFLVDLYWDEPTNARDLVESLLSMVPGIRTMRSEHGEWWRAPNWWTPAWQAVTDIVVGRGATRSGPIRTRLPEDGLVNDITVDYARTVPGGPTGRVRYTAAADPADLRVVPDPRCARSQLRHGLRAYSAELPTWNRATAELHASGVLALGAEPRRGVPVVVRASSRTERLARGDVVSLTDRALGWSELPAEVESVVIGGSQVRLDLTVL